MILAALCAPAHGDETITLRPRYQVGDRYALALSTKTKTRVEARGGARNAFREDVALKYRAQVEVLATDAAGAPQRERHESVDLRYQRPEGAKTLFAPGAAFELTRKSDGTVETPSPASASRPRSSRSSAICSRTRPSTRWRHCSIPDAPWRPWARARWKPRGSSAISPSRLPS